ncbi:MAG: GNAT family N-acetyltransferase [Eubacteriales bacterium]|nr:GNAT family N-acetyltransferase [Eubacteriales bacterium]
MADLIKFTRDYEQIIPLWQEAFGDSEDDVLFFLNGCKNKKCLGYYKGERLVSMMFLVDCLCDGKNMKYIYAASTLKSEQGKGYMSKLLDYCRKNAGSFCLVPADESLVTFYEKRGMADKTETFLLSFDEDEEIKEYLLEGCSLEKPFVMQYFRK